MQPHNSVYDATRNTWMIPDTQMEVEVILASACPGCPDIYTLRLRYPRIIHSEIMTHRVFSRNARSSRAVPVNRMIQEIRSDPFVPWHWGKNQKGMQAGEECDTSVRLPTRDWQSIYDDGYQELDRKEAWLWARDKAEIAAQSFMDAGYHKQIANRLLEPFMYIDTLITSTQWSNFDWLRDHKDAEPHLQDLAKLVKKALQSAVIQNLAIGMWHLPYITPADVALSAENVRKISSARCARISYAPFDGDPSYERELERYDSLVKSDRIHASPLEHQAKPDPDGLLTHLHGNFSGWVQFRKTIINECM